MRILVNSGNNKTVRLLLLSMKTVQLDYMLHPIFSKNNVITTSQIVHVDIDTLTQNCTVLTASNLYKQIEDLAINELKSRVLQDFKEDNLWQFPNRPLRVLFPKTALGGRYADLVIMYGNQVRPYSIEFEEYRLIYFEEINADMLKMLNADAELVIETL